MSISGALSSALSGLTAASRAAEIVSSNVANARTEGYARREIALTARSVGGVGQGVSVTGVIRATDLVLMNDRRSSQAGASAFDVTATFFRRLEGVIGTPETEGSLGQKVANFDRALIEASARPDSEARLSAVLHAAKSLATGLQDVSSQIQSSRLTADRRIGVEVTALNKALVRIEDLNTKIRNLSGNGRDTSALMDQRQQMVDSIAATIPLREVRRDNGEIALLTTTGDILLDGKASVFGFTPTEMIVPEMTVATGGLSGLTLNGRAMITHGDDSKMKSGTLSALFAVRDDLSVEAQSRLDSMAASLIGRFSQGTDQTLPVGSAGLFTDKDEALLPDREVGLSARLAVNAVVDPARTGDLWRLRDGLGATSPGPVGNSTFLTAMSEALNGMRGRSTGAVAGGNVSFSTLAADMTSYASGNRLSADTDASYSSARFTALKELELQGGVDTDQELQSLLLIEQSYAANAKVIQSVDDMIKTLLGM